MSNPIPATTNRPAAQARSAEPLSGPFAQITVAHVLGPVADDPFTFSAEDGAASRVTVESGGKITITWQKDDAPAELYFNLTSPDESSFLYGILLGWSELHVPTGKPSYPLNCSLEVVQTDSRTLHVTLGPSLETYTYLLYVAYPKSDGLEIHMIDPKIYNTGDGPPSGHR